MTSKPLLKRKQFMSILAAILIFLQVPLWIGTGSVFSLLNTYYNQYKVIQDNARLSLANNQLIDKIAALKNGTDEINSRARLELGLLGSDETYYQVVK